MTCICDAIDDTAPAVVAEAVRTPGEWLRVLRHALDLSPVEMANVLCVDVGDVHEMEESGDVPVYIARRAKKIGAPELERHARGTW